MTSNVTSWVFIFIGISFVTLTRAVSVPWFLRYADWNSEHSKWVIIWVCICSNTILSVSFETYCRLLTGLQFLYKRSSLDFFSSGRTSAHFQSSANSPDSSDKLIIFVMIGRSTSMQSIIRDVGIGSLWDKRKTKNHNLFYERMTLP